MLKKSKIKKMFVFEQNAGTIQNKIIRFLRETKS